MKRRKYRNWEKVFSDWEKSGLSRSEYCREKGINQGVFQRNFKKLKWSSSIQHDLAVNEEKKPAFVEVMADPIPSPDSLLRITTRSGCVLEIPL